MLLLESGVETVPRELWDHPQVRRAALRYGIHPSEMLVDKSLHYHAMAGLPRKWKRGRPDIVHVTLLNLLESPLNAAGALEVYMHVIDGRVFAFRPDVRIPKNYERFKGLMAQLLREERVPPGSGDPLIYKVADRLADFTRRFGGVILMWEKGGDATPGYVAVRGLATGMPVGIGMFPRGDFEKSTLRKAVEAYRIAGGRPLPAWIVASRLVEAAERIMGLL
ncbi:ribosome biogenesis protein [Stetteria hydrogenophila]